MSSFMLILKTYVIIKNLGKYWQFMDSDVLSLQMKLAKEVLGMLENFLEWCK